MCVLYGEHPPENYVFLPAIGELGATLFGANGDILARMTAKNHHSKMCERKNTPAQRSIKIRLLIISYVYFTREKREERRKMFYKYASGYNDHNYILCGNFPN